MRHGNMKTRKCGLKLILPIENPDSVQHELDTKLPPALSHVVLHNSGQVLGVAWEWEWGMEIWNHRNCNTWSKYS